MLAHRLVLAAAMAPGAAGSASQPADSAGASDNAEQHETQPLRELNKRSAQFGTWVVVVRQPQVDTYDYKWDGKARTGKAFSCVFVCFQDFTEYCIGQMRYTRATEQNFLIYLRKS